LVLDKNQNKGIFFYPLAMSAKITIGSKEHEVSSGQTICDAVHSLRFSPDAFIFMISDKPVPMDTQISDGVQIKAVKVASGG